MSRNPLPSVDTISLTDYNKTYGADVSASFYVINRAPNNWGSADLLFTVNGDNGRSIGVVVPASFAPIDLTMFAARESLVACTELRTLLQKGFLLIVDNESAAAALKDPRVQTELQRVLNFNRASNNDSGSAGGKVQLGDNGAQYGTTQGDYEETPIVTELLTMAAETTDQATIENAFIRNATKLTRADLQYIVRRNVNPQLTNLCVDELN